jgi:predicted nucleotidyltransferase
MINCVKIKGKIKWEVSAMNTLGIVVEYNPFHNGHLFHLKHSIKKVNASHTIAAMSGDFVQRGTPAFTDKWVRTKMALDSGINLVIELPTLFAIQDAGGFATGAVKLLERTGVCKNLVFGSESNNIDSLKFLAKMMVENEYTLSEMEEKYVKKGFSHPNARKYALKDFLYNMSMDDDKREQIIEILARSNDILGIEYLKALKIIRSEIEPNCIPRTGSAYNDNKIAANFSSATAIRKAFQMKKTTGIKENVPLHVWETLETLEEKLKLPNLEHYEITLLNKLRALTRDHLKKFYGFTEGLDLRFLKAALLSRNLEELLQKVKSKRFTYTRLQRLLLYFLFEITKQDISESEEFGPQYIRVLGFDEKGREVLSEMRDRATIPIISTPSIYNKAYSKYEKRFDNPERDAFGKKPYFSTYEMFKKQIQFDFRCADYYTTLQCGYLPDRMMDIKQRPLMAKS